MRDGCRSCPIRSTALCRALPEPALEGLGRIVRRRRVSAGRAIFSTGDEALHVANLICGVAKLSRSLPDGRTQIVGLYFPSDFIGRPFVEPAPLLIDAATDVELCYLTRSRFEALVLEHADLQRLLMQRVIGDLDAAQAWMLVLGCKTAEERVASFLLHYLRKLEATRCQPADRGSGVRLELPLSRTEIGEFLGLTIETVGRMLRRLERAGIIAIAGRTIKVLDVAGLAAGTQQERP